METGIEPIISGYIVSTEGLQMHLKYAGIFWQKWCHKIWFTVLLIDHFIFYKPIPIMSVYYLI